MITDHVEKICDLMVAELNDAQNWENPPSVIFSAEKTDNPLDELDVKQPNLKVYVIPVSEAGEVAGHPGAPWLMEWVVNMLIVKAYDDRYDRTRLSQFDRELDYHLRGRILRDGDYKYTMRGMEQDRRYDTQLHREKGQFAAMRTYTYFGMDCG